MFISGLRTLSPLSPARNLLFPEQDDRACDINSRIGSGHQSDDESSGEFMDDIPAGEEKD
jgi:hypothetical protein